MVEPREKSEVYKIEYKKTNHKKNAILVSQKGKRIKEQKNIVAM